jgi:hypothetical protein
VTRRPARSDDEGWRARPYGEHSLALRGEQEAPLAPTRRPRTATVATMDGLMCALTLRGERPDRDQNRTGLDRTGLGVRGARRGADEPIGDRQFLNQDLHLVSIGS